MEYKAENPILIIFFNRPKELKILLNAISRVKPSKIYLSQDGPRGPEDLGNHSKCRQIIKDSISWPCNIFENFYDVNKGCKLAVSGAIRWFFSKESQGIILEDDCIPSTDFFTFCDAMLEKYKNNMQVGSISGYNVTNQWLEPVKESYYFSKLPLVWGWASWTDRLKEYSVTINNYESNKENVLNQLPSNEVRSYWDYLFMKVQLGLIDTWDYQLNYYFWTRGLVSIVPRHSLIDNIGFTPDSTNTKETPSFLKKQSVYPNELSPPYISPTSSQIDVTRDNVFLKKTIDSGYLKNHGLFKKIALKVLYRSYLLKRKFL